MDPQSGPKVATLTGLAIGDALGMPFETAGYLDERLQAWNGEYQRSEYHKLDSGQWTDDTLMSLEISKSLTSCGAFSPQDVATRYIGLYKSENHRGMGKATEEALGRLTHKVPWCSSGVAGAEGNGAAMRAAPLGLFFRHNLNYVKDVVRVEAAITHRSQVAIDGAVAVALAIAFLARGDFSHERRKGLASFVADALPSGHIQAGLRKAEIKSQTKTDRPWDILASMGTSSNVIQTIPAAFCAFQMNRDFQSTVETAIRAGGDTDTIAAMAGAMAGTFYGIEQTLKYRPTLEAADDIRTLEQKLWANAPKFY